MDRSIDDLIVANAEMPEEDWLARLESFDYRLVDLTRGGFQFAEVYYGPDSEVIAYVTPVSPFGENLGELGGDMAHLMTAFAKPIIREADLPH